LVRIQPWRRAATEQRLGAATFALEAYRKLPTTIGYHRSYALTPDAENVLTTLARAIRNWQSRGLIPALVLGHRSLLFRLDAVLAALDKRTVKRRTFYEMHV
jgi:hypothetical protein